MKKFGEKFLIPILVIVLAFIVFTQKNYRKNRTCLAKKIKKSSVLSYFQDLQACQIDPLIKT